MKSEREKSLSPPNKKIKKLFKNLLTNGSRYDIINTERGKENPTNQERKKL